MIIQSVSLKGKRSLSHVKSVLLYNPFCFHVAFYWGPNWTLHVSPCPRVPNVPPPEEPQMSVLSFHICEVGESSVQLLSCCIQNCQHPCRGHGHQRLHSTQGLGMRCSLLLLLEGMHLASPCRREYGREKEPAAQRLQFSPTRVWPYTWSIPT